MKYLMISIALVGATATASAFAQSNSSYGQPAAGKTRAQVYQELVQAQQNGQLTHLNKTIYEHS
jgi:Domain of unknown function (DUF4148)